MSAQHSVANRTRDVATVATVGVVLALLVFPFVWVVVTSLRPAEELLQSELRLFPGGVNLDGYSELLTSGFVRYLLNSLAVCATAAAVSVALALAAYSFSRRSFRGRSVLLLLVVFSQVFPFIVLVPSVYAAFVRLELVNTYAGLVIAYIAITVPFSVYLLLGYLDSVPTELDDAAKVDGCSTPRDPSRRRHHGDLCVRRRVGGVPVRRRAHDRPGEVDGTRGTGRVPRRVQLPVGPRHGGLGADDPADARHLPGAAAGPGVRARRGLGQVTLQVTLSVPPAVPPNVVLIL